MPTHIMAINDSPEILDVLHDILTDEGYEVKGYLAPDLAIVNLGNIKPDLIILDWLFGQEYRGMQMLQRLKLHPSTKNIPVLVCTASVRAVQEIADYLQGKGVTVIFKPFGADELVETVDKALQGSQRAPSDTDESAFLDRLERLAENLPGGGRRG